MKFVNELRLKENANALQDMWRNNKAENGFAYLYFDDFLQKDVADKLYDNYPVLSELGNETRTYLNGKGKYQMTHFEEAPLFGELIDEIHSQEFLDIITSITGIENIVGDEELFGGGLHQSVDGAFLNVHIDFNKHPNTGFYRRMNILIYMNKDWKDEYEGHLELWNMDKNKMINKLAPSFNRCVIFETNNVSWHGHPKPLNLPDGMARNSIASYYYTKEKPAHETGEAHSTLYKNTESTKGMIKQVKNVFTAIKDKITKS